MEQGPPEPHEPRTLALWRCIGCGAMGRPGACTGQCAFRAVSVVEAQAYADLYEAGEGAQALAAAARPLLDALARIGRDGARLEHGYGALQDEARAALRAFPPLAFDLTDDRPETWLCDVCGQVEAPQECLGVCVRPTRDFVVEEDYAALAATTQTAVTAAARLRSLLSEIARSRPREGQWARAAGHFADVAESLADR